MALVSEVYAVALVCPSLFPCLRFFGQFSVLNQGRGPSEIPWLGCSALNEPILKKRHERSKKRARRKVVLIIYHFHKLSLRNSCIRKPSEQEWCEMVGKRCLLHVCKYPQASVFQCPLLNDEYRIPSPAGRKSYYLSLLLTYMLVESWLRSLRCVASATFWPSNGRCKAMQQLVPVTPSQLVL